MSMGPALCIGALRLLALPVGSRLIRASERLGVAQAVLVR